MTEFDRLLLREHDTSETHHANSVSFDDEDSVIARNKRGMTWIQMKEHLQMSGCVICHMVNQSIRKRVNYLLYEYVLDVSVRKKLHALFGFCRRHSRLAEEVESELNSDGPHLGTLFETVLLHEIQQLKKCEKSKSNRRPVKPGLVRQKKNGDTVSHANRQKLTPAQECMVCVSERESEAYYAMIMSQMQPDEEFRELYKKDPILLGRPHFMILQNESTEPDAIDYFLEQQIMKLKCLHEQLFEFLEKHDVKRAHEPHGAERNSWRTTLEHFSSKEDFNRLWNHQPIH